MITLPTLQDGDLIQATANGTPGWLRAVTVVDGAVALAQFIPKGIRQQQELTNPTITEPKMMIRSEVMAASVFDALIKSVGITAAIQATK